MPKTVLLADDSVTIQKVVGISFASEDVTLVTVDNGDDAISKAREVGPDVILADVVMPGKNGYEVCEAVKADPGLQHIPVLLLTGTFEAFDEERARAAGAAAHVAKPFEAQTLIEQVNRLLREGPPAAAAAPAPAPEAPSAPDLEQADAFDFFDDDTGVSDFAETAPEPAEELDTGEPLSVESPDSAFAFGDDAFPPAGRDTPSLGALDEPLPAASHSGRGGDRTVAILPDVPAGAGPGGGPFGDDDATPLATRLEPALPGGDPGHLLESTPDADDSFSSPYPGVTPAEEMLDFDFERSGTTLESDDSLLRVETDDLAQATVLDPEGASGFDVSVSDLGDPLATQLVDAPPAAPPAAAAASVEPPRAQPPVPVPAARPPARPEPASDASARVAAAVEQIAPAVRDQLHATLEKVAWDALGNLSEEIVSKTVERVEAIAWEVIPQMAEVLVREEIRRLKGDDGD